MARPFEFLVMVKKIKNVFSTLVLLFAVSLSISALLFSSIASAFDEGSEGEWLFEYGIEYQLFDKPGFQDQEEQKFAISLKGEYNREWNDGNDRFQFVPFLRWDQEDEERTHFDVRELYWQHIAEEWDLKVGISKVFWGKTEFARLVDVVNQVDFVEDGGGDARLGQPMVAGTHAFESGDFEWYVLAGFRERTFPGEGGRLRLPLTVDTSNPKIEDGKGFIHGLDFAVRWQQWLNDACEIALSQFTGLGREPGFTFNFDFLDPELLPVYNHINQTGLETECIVGDWAFKLESSFVDDKGPDDYHAYSVGVEYTFADIMRSGHDITAVVEYIYDSREELATHFFEQDVVLGARWAANDVAGTEAVMGLIYDHKTEEKIFSIEGSRRIGEETTISIAARVIYEEGEEETSDDLFELLGSLASTPLFEEAIQSDEFKVFLADLILSNGLQELFLSDPINVLQNLELISDFERKLRPLDNDDYIEIELTRYF